MRGVWYVCGPTGDGLESEANGHQLLQYAWRLQRDCECCKRRVEGADVRIANSTAPRRMDAGQLHELDERHDQGHSADHHRTQTNGHALLKLPHLATQQSQVGSQRCLGLLKVRPQRSGRGSGRGREVGACARRSERNGEREAPRRWRSDPL